MRFKDFLKLQEQNTVGKHNDTANGAFLPTSWTGSDNGSGLERNGLHLPGLDLVPTVTKNAQITYIEMNKNPILILLSDGTRLNLSWDEFKRIPGPPPKVGRQMTVVFQRFPGDATESFSQVASVTVH